MINSFFRNARIVNAGNVGQSLSAQPLLPIGDASLGKSNFLIIFQCCQLILKMSTVDNTAISCLGIYLVPFSFPGLFVFTFVNYVSCYVCGYLSASSLVFLDRMEVHHCSYFCFITGFFFQFFEGFISVQ